jgi:signal transduction histidine kinase/ActR/RegA family two-component response regulator
LFSEIQTKGSVSNVETAYRTKDGQKVLMLFSASVIADEGPEAGIACVAVDITEQEKMREEILNLAKLESVGVLAGGLAHDFNNLLQGVFGYISLAKTSTEAGGEVQELLDKAEKALVMSKNLTLQLLTFAKGGEPIKKVLNLRKTVQDSVRFGLSGTNIDCSITMDDDIWPVEADEGQLSQVFQNMMINSTEAMTAGGTIRITAKNFINTGEATPSLKPGKYVLISIEDNGEGIDEEHINKIFDPYYTTKEKGSGLGLATSYSIIKKHGGIIEVHSEPGAGTTFTIYLPASDKDMPTAASQAAIIPQTSGGNILIMDDDEMVRNIVEKMLRKLGFEAVFAVNGEEALAKYRQAMETGPAFDAVILDLTIKGGMGGRETIAKLIELDPEVKAVVSSGYSADTVIANFQQYGFRYALAKPFTIAKLAKTLHELV